MAASGGVPGSPFLGLGGGKNEGAAKPLKGETEPLAEGGEPKTIIRYAEEEDWPAEEGGEAGSAAEEHPSGGRRPAHRRHALQPSHGQSLKTTFSLWSLGLTETRH